MKPKNAKALVTIYTPTIKRKDGIDNLGYKMYIDYDRTGKNKPKRIDLSVEKGLDAYPSTYSQQITDAPYMHELGPYKKIISWLSSI